MHAEFNTDAIEPIGCAKEAWAVIRPDYWLAFAITLVGMLVGGVTMYILLGAMMCGIFYALLRKMDGGELALDDVWKGLEFFWPGLVVTLVIVVPMVLVCALIYVPIALAIVTGPRLSEDELIAMIVGAAVVDLIVIVVMVCLHTLLIFSFPLIVDRRLGAVRSITTSARAVLKNLGGVVGLILVNMGLTFAGLLLCGVGVYLAMPLMLATNVVAYRKVFPRLDTGSDLPPPPNAYRGL
ncbi:MAG: hypothetical protein ACK4S4_06085 [Pyrinomonadaceae bacterium]